MKTVEEVVEFCATIHNRVLSPDLLILDDIESYIEQLQVKRQTRNAVCGLVDNPGNSPRKITLAFCAKLDSYIF